MWPRRLPGRPRKDSATAVPNPAPNPSSNPRPNARTPERPNPAVSELPAPCRRPSLDDDFLLGEQVDRVTPVRVEVAEEALLPARERKVRHRRGDAHVDPDVADARLVTELPRRRA